MPVAELAVIVLIIVAFLWDRRTHAADMRAREVAWTAERSELLTRIQHPERIPTPAAVPFEQPEHEPDQYSLVGQILDLVEPGAE